MWLREETEDGAPGAGLVCDLAQLVWVAPLQASLGRGPSDQVQGPFHPWIWSSPPLVLLEGGLFRDAQARRQISWGDGSWLTLIVWWDLDPGF